MQFISLTNRIHYTPNDPDTDRPVLGYIRGDRFSVMVDAGNSPAHASDFLAAVAERNLPRPEFCILTHWHWDHTFGMYGLPSKTIAHEKTNRILGRLSQWKWDDDSMKARLASGEEIPFADEHIRAEYADPETIRVQTADMTFSRYLTIDCGGITCHCIHLPSAHSDDSVVVYIPEERAAFIGDIYGDDYYQNHYRDLKKTQDLYQALTALELETIVPGHGRPEKKGVILEFLERFIP